MSYHIMSYDALQANISAAGTTIILCRANLEQVDLSPGERMDLLWRIECQIAELKGMQVELDRMSQHMQASQNLIKPRLQPRNFTSAGET